MIDKSVFELQKFESFGICQLVYITCAMRIIDGWKPTGESDLAELREKIRDIVWEKADNYRAVEKEKISDYNFVLKFCSIPNDTYKKTINGKCKLSRNFIAKLSVGLKLELHEANALFGPQSGELNLTNNFDYIVFHALQDKDEIDIFIEDVYKHLGINLNKEHL